MISFRDTQYRITTARGLSALLLCVAFGMTGCGGDRSRTVDAQHPGFATTDASELYFNNVRSAYYDIETNDAAGLKVYRYRDSVTDTTRFALNPSIVINWRADMAYILLEPSGPLSPGETFTLECLGPAGELIEEMTWNQGSAQEQYMFAAKLFNGLMPDDTAIVLIYRGRRMNVLDGPGEMKSTKTVLRDYFRLVEAI